MEPFTTFMNVESTRSYIDNLYSSDPDKCLISITCIKNSVIGSNRQKESVIAEGIVPRLLQLLEDRNTRTALRIEAAVTIGSLAKGTKEHVELLISAGTMQIFCDILEAETEPRLLDAALCCLSTLSRSPSRCRYETRRLQKLLSFAVVTENLQRQTYVTSILAVASKTQEELNDMIAIGAPSILTLLLPVESYLVKIPVLTCLASMCYKNSNVVNVVANMTCHEMKIPDYLSTLISRDKPIEMQLEASRCLTNIYRAYVMQSFNPLIVQRTLLTLVRLCQSDLTEAELAAATDSLACLTEVDCNLQQTAAVNTRLINALAKVLECKSGASKRAAFRAFASLAANDEDVRKRITETKCLMSNILQGLDEKSDQVLRLAAVRCVHSMSRSVQQLRTTFQDLAVWRPLMDVLTDDSPPSSTELLMAASSALCNLLLEFSPAKEPMLQQGVIHLLTTLISRTDLEEPSLRLNGVWALMNLAYRSEQPVKSQILQALGTDQIFRLLADSDVRVLMKTLGLLRNLVSPRGHTDTMMALHGQQVMQAVVLVLEGAHPPEVKEQALCILGNIADGETAREHIMSNEDVLKKLLDYMTHPATCLQGAAVFCIGNLTRLGEHGSMERQQRLREMGCVNTLQQLLSTADMVLYNRVKTALTQFTDV